MTLNLPSVWSSKIILSWILDCYITQAIVLKIKKVSALIMWYSKWEHILLKSPQTIIDMWKYGFLSSSS